MTDGDLDEPDADQEASGETELDDDDIVDIQSVADDVEAATDDRDVEADDTDGTTDETTGDTDGTTDDRDRVSPGTVYTNGLGAAGAALRGRYGSVDDPRTTAEEYSELARDLEIDKAVDDWLEEQGGVEELTPGQTVVVTTLLWGAMVGIDDPDVIGGLIDDLGGGEE